MEKLRPGYEVNPENNYDLQVIFDDVVKRETEYHPELTSRRKKLIFIQESFGWWGPMEIAHILGIDEKHARRFLSRRGIRNNELEELEERFNAAFAITSIIEKHVPGIILRRDILFKRNALLNDNGIKKMLEMGEGRKAVFVAEKTFRHIHEQG